MKKKIFPDSILEQTTERLIYDNRKNIGVIYFIVLVAVVAAFVSIFFIKVDIGVRAAAQIKPKGERIVITIPNPGQLVFNDISENVQVSKGDTLFIVKSDAITSQLSSLQTRQSELVEMISDLGSLTMQFVPSDFAPQSSIYKQALTYYETQLLELAIEKESIEKNYLRDKELFRKKVISAFDFDKVEFEYNRIGISKNILIDRYRSQWQADKDAYEVELRDIEIKLRQIDIQCEEMIVKSPVNGTIHKIENIANGTYVHGGQQVLEISPEGLLVAECYIQPIDIGLLRIGQKCRIQIDAYNYNDWGVISGNVIEIFEDITPSGDQSTYFYKIYCSLDSETLSLKNGYTGQVKKGMSAQVRFIVTERTLYQLLYDKIDDWINPNIGRI